MAITPKSGDLTAGLAGQRSEIVNASPDPLITGDVPALFNTVEVAGEAMDGYTVVGFNGTGEVVPAVLGTTAAIGILAYAVEAGDKVGTYRGGVFNPKLLAWDDSYATDADKKTAFEGAPSPTQIVIRAPEAMTV